MGHATFATDLEDYREVERIKVPFTVHQTNPHVSLVTKITEVKHNVPIEDAQFAKPTAP